MSGFDFTTPRTGKLLDVKEILYRGGYGHNANVTLFRIGKYAWVEGSTAAGYPRKLDMYVSINPAQMQQAIPIICDLLNTKDAPTADAGFANRITGSNGAIPPGNQVYLRFDNPNHPSVKPFLEELTNKLYAANIQPDPKPVGPSSLPVMCTNRTSSTYLNYNAEVAALNDNPFKDLTVRTPGPITTAEWFQGNPNYQALMNRIEAINKRQSRIGQSTQKNEAKKEALNAVQEAVTSGKTPQEIYQLLQEKAEIIKQSTASDWKPGLFRAKTPDSVAPYQALMQDIERQWPDVKTAASIAQIARPTT